MKYYLLILSCLMLWSCDGADYAEQGKLKPNGEAISNIDLAKAAWLDSNISRYRMHVFRDTVEASGAYDNTVGNVYSENSLVLVNNQKIVESYQLSGASFFEYEPQMPNASTAMTVEELFMMVEDAFISERIVGQVNFHELGYPQDFQYFDSEGGLVSIHVEDFYYPQAVVAKLGRKKREWIEKGSANYSMVLALHCRDFCEATSQFYSEVVDSECVSKGYYETPPVNISLDYFPVSMVDLYDKAIAAADTLDSKFTVSYHPDGHLNAYYLDSPFGFSVGDLGFEVKSLSLLQ
ncbi:hypothetical protein [Marinagarivorans cellulosilyticus]|uniref:Uncharacterized protein n=1 Tax=Marinagarivorans cellulosilyticus TaxID=2721545 RepID=A0AAN1WIC6_9GAMM|nr:hypothetical protein [Marinagarivorans cellulosilyticus]BCD98114.1 hypothetical protein MARGE09_P2315 [Marinagarivorans cellulosilyticus]